MELKPLPIIIGMCILLVVAGGALWYVLTRPVSPAVVPTPLTKEEDLSPPQKYADSGAYYEITATYPKTAGIEKTAGKEADARAAAAMKFFIEQEAARFKDTNLSELTDEDIRVLGLGGDRRYTLDITYKKYVSPVASSYVYQLFTDTLGAHPNSYYRTFAFSSKTGDALRLEDLFMPSTDYLTVLSTLSREKLKKQMEAIGGVEPDKDMLEAGTTPDADNFQNFYFDGEDFVLIFPPYQVAPYVYGVQEVRIPTGELTQILRSEYR